MDNDQARLRKNKHKKNDKQPDWTGFGKVAGIACDIAAWNKVRDDGGKYLSLALTPKKETDGSRVNAFLARVREEADDGHDAEGKIFDTDWDIKVWTKRLADKSVEFQLRFDGTGNPFNPEVSEDTGSFLDDPETDEDEIPF